MRFAAGGGCGEPQNRLPPIFTPLRRLRPETKSKPTELSVEVTRLGCPAAPDLRPFAEQTLRRCARGTFGLTRLLAQPHSFADTNRLGSSRGRCDFVRSRDRPEPPQVEACASRARSTDSDLRTHGGLTQVGSSAARHRLSFFCIFAVFFSHFRPEKREQHTDRRMP